MSPDDHMGATDPKSIDLFSDARIAYEAYRQHSDGKSLISGHPIPEFDRLSPEIRDAWVTAARAVMAKADDDRKHGMTATVESEIVLHEGDLELPFDQFATRLLAPVMSWIQECVKYDGDAILRIRVDFNPRKALTG